MGGSAHLEIDSTSDGDVSQVRLAGELDLDGVDAVSELLTKLAEAGASTVRIDVAGITFLDSSGLRALLSGHQALAAVGASMQLVQVSPAVQRVLDITGTRDLLIPT